MQIGQVYVVLSCFNSFLFHNYLIVMSTVTYSLQIYTPDTNVDNVQIVRVSIVGEEFIETERKTVIDLANRPQTETQGYVKYQTLRRSAFITFPITKKVENMVHGGVFLVTCKVFGNVVRYCLNCFVYLLNQK